MTTSRHATILSGVAGLALGAILLVLTVYLTRFMGTVRLLGAGWNDLVHFTTLGVHLRVWVVYAVPAVTGLLGLLISAWAGCRLLLGDRSSSVPSVSPW